jgi:NAD+ kinase
MTIAVYARSTKDNHPLYIEKISAIVKKHNVDLIVYAPYSEFLQKNYNFKTELKTFSNASQLSKAECVICLGGDGTMLETLAFVQRSGIPVLGVNTGRLGFLASVSKDDIEKYIELFLQKKYTLDKRELLELVGGEDFFEEVNYALNEFTIHKKDSSAMINIDTYVDGVFLNSYFADGLIISTPTGSTAYSLSCGGPIMIPDSENFIITPIAPHNLNVRPIVISANKTLSFKISGRYDSFNIALDSRNAQLNSLTEIKVKKASFTFNMVSFEGQHFFETLRNKLLWGIDKRH